MAENKSNHPGRPVEPSSQAAADGKPADAVPGEESPSEVAALLDQLRADLDEAKDHVLRSHAELENYRKRAAREIEEHRRFANLPLMRDLLPVLDNLERAVAAAEKTHDVNTLLDGVKMVSQHFEDALKRYHCVRIPALHEPFNPHLHEAISQQPSEEYPAGTVVMVVVPGFQLYDRVVRPSQVIVAVPKDPQ